ncbi:hypothetical protein J3R30DRAFT_3882194 [Lentinula aciculospora]|uniref:Virilizer N-terminal domain-containing protein n=1 Tax=Lentinula aciculospora TaxID=153920 RepID=A0A9W9AC00_9AGAR|nr:hypothetical protein J3R30DRAFT_3882194 [Lentinula aciculospora]
MKLLHWCTLVPQGPSGLAAIRFVKLVRIKCIRVFPKGAKPFKQCPDIFGETEPDSFLLDVFFNAQLVQLSSESKEKQRATNALVPTTIAYAGGQVDFTVDLGTEYATRLMIVKGQFDALSLAIYGEVVSESIIPPLSGGEIASSVPKSIPSVEARTLSASIDPANSTDPTFLARNLLSLLEDTPPLSLVSKLMFCLKPDSDDWDEPDFPYLFVDFDRDIFQSSLKTEEDDETMNSGEDQINFDIEATLDAMSKPVSDTVAEGTLTKFAQVVADNIDSKPNQALHIAKLFKLAASQRPSLALALCQAIEFHTVFDARSLDEDILLHLLDASANADIARYLHTDYFLDMLAEFQSPSIGVAQTKTAKQAAERLVTRLQAWEVFEDALSNTQTNFAAAIAFLRDIGAGEQSLGIWLASMTKHIDLITKLAENPIVPNSSGMYPKLFVRNGVSGSMSVGGAISHDEFIAFVRAFIGVASVLAVWAWSDSLGNDVCRERTLGVLRLWQSTDGYREIVNYLLLLRQFTLRLKWITSNDTPRKSGIFGEQILSDLLDEPDAALNDDLVQTILSLKQPLSHISENDRLSMRKIALVVEDGLPAAIEELTLTNTHPLSHRRLRTLRVSIALVERELAEDPRKGDWNVLQAIWDEQSTALAPRLTELLGETARDLNGYFRITSPFPAQHQAKTQPQISTAASLPQVLTQLFQLAEDLLVLLLHLTTVPDASLSPNFPPLSFSLSAYTLRSLVLSVADIFACTDIADTMYTQGTPTCISAQSTRQACLEFVRRASNTGPGGVIVEPEGGKSGGEIVMSELLKHGVARSGRDPAYHLLQMFALIDYVLPELNSGTGAGTDLVHEHWVLQVLPNVSNETQEFFRQLDVESKVYLLRRLVRLDSQNLVGAAEWLFTEEMKLFERCTKTLLSSIETSNDQRDTNIQTVVLLYQIGLHVRLLEHMLQTGSDMLAWCLEILRTVQEASSSLTTSMVDLSIARVASSHLDAVVKTLLIHFDDGDNGFKSTLIVLFLRAVRLGEKSDSLWSKVVTLLKTLPLESIDLAVLRLDVGHALAAIASDSLSPEISSVILSLMTWLTAQAAEKKLSTLCGIKADTLVTLYDTLAASLPENQLSALDRLRTTLIVDGDETFVPANMNIPDTLQLSLQELRDILSPTSLKPITPTTPTRTSVPDVLGLVISPPAALLRSPAATGLTKTYLNNEFRDLRQAAVTRQNTSRLPSMHVDVGITGQLT